MTSMPTDFHSTSSSPSGEERAGEKGAPSTGADRNTHDRVAAPCAERHPRVGHPVRRHPPPTCRSSRPDHEENLAATRSEVVFAELVRGHVGRMLRVARRFLSNDDLAWDAVQESLLSLWRAPERPADPGPWLVRTVIHRCLHLLRTARRRCHYEGQAESATPIVHRDDPAARLEGRSLRRALEAAVHTLPVDQRLVFVLREIDGLEYAQIAQALGLPLGTVRSRLSRAREVLRRRLVLLWQDSRES